MATASDTASLFRRLSAIRGVLEQSRVDLGGLLNNVNSEDTGERNADDPEPDLDGWNPAEDLKLQIEHGLEQLDETIDALTPLPNHVDQRLAGNTEVSHA